MGFGLGVGLGENLNVSDPGIELGVLGLVRVTRRVRVRHRLGVGLGV